MKLKTSPTLDLRYTRTCPSWFLLDARFGKALVMAGRKREDDLGAPYWFRNKADATRYATLLHRIYPHLPKVKPRRFWICPDGTVIFNPKTFMGNVIIVLIEGGWLAIQHTEVRKKLGMWGLTGDVLEHDGVLWTQPLRPAHCT